MKRNFPFILTIVLIVSSLLPSTANASKADNANDQAVVYRAPQLASPPPPPNDSFAGAIQITGLTFKDMQDTTSATNFDNTDPNPVGPCSDAPLVNGSPVALKAGFKSVWYYYMPPVDQSIQADTIGSTKVEDSTQDWDTYLAVWKLEADNSLTLVSCDDDYLGALTSRVTFLASQNTTYYFEIAQYNGYVGDADGTPIPGNLVFNAHITNTDVWVGTSLMGSYYLYPGEEMREYYPVSGGPVIVDSTNATNIAAAIRLQSYANNTLYSFVETMGVPESLLSYKYYFPTYNNTWAPLNSQLRFANINDTDVTVRVTIGTAHWDYPVPAHSERREYLPVSGGPVIIESLDPITLNSDPTKKIIAAIRLQSYASNTLYSFAETMGIPVEQLSNTYYFPTYNNTWGPLNSQLRFANINDTDLTVRVTIGTLPPHDYSVPAHSERREYLPVSGGPVIIKSLDPDPSKKIIAAIRLQSYANNQLYSFVETMGIPSGLLSYKYYFPTYNNTWAPLNSQIRFGNLDSQATTIRVTIGGNVVWEQSVPGLEERRLYFDVSGGPVIIESLDPSKKIAAAIRLQSLANNTLYSFAETKGISVEQLSTTYYFPTYNNTWIPLNSQVRFGVP